MDHPDRGAHASAPIRRSAHWLASLFLLAAACADDFTPRSVLEDLRVLALQAAPLEVGPGESVTLTPVRLAPPGSGAAITEERWTFCPFSVGATAGFACAVPECEVPLEGGGTPTPGAGGIADPSAIGLSVTADPGALAQQCLAQLAARGALPPDVPSELPQKVDTVFRYTAVASDGATRSTREAIQLVPFYPGGAPGAPFGPNLPPDLRQVRIAGTAVEPGGTGATLEPGTALDVEVDVADESKQTYLDDAGQQVDETLVVSFFTTAGRFDFDRANVPGAKVKLKHEEIGPNVVEARLWVVATDLRGGQTVEGPFVVPIRR